MTEAQPDIRPHVAAALQRARDGARWFAIGTVVFTPIALMLSVLALFVVFEWIATSPYEHGPIGRNAWVDDLGITFPVLVVFGLLVFAARGAGRSPWVVAGFSAFALLVGLTYGTSLRETWELSFWLTWSALAIVAITAVSQPYADKPGHTHSIIAVLPNAVLLAFRTVLRDVVLRRGEDTDLDRAAALVWAVHRGDTARQRRLLDAASAHGIDLRRRLIAAKLIRESRGVLRIGDAAPPEMGE